MSESLRVSVPRSLSRSVPRRIGILAVASASALAPAACGGGDQQAQTAGAAVSTASGAAQGAGQSAGDAIPQETVTEAGGGDNDGDEAKIPQGTDADQAEAAGMGSDGAPVITVTNTDTSCIPDTGTVPAGKVWIKVMNEGTKITEMYLESAAGDELVEVENVTKGKSAAFTTTVEAGSYLIACEPGMADVQIRTPLAVTAS